MGIVVRFAADLVMAGVSWFAMVSAAAFDSKSRYIAVCPGYSVKRNSRPRHAILCADYHGAPWSRPWPRYDMPRKRQSVSSFPDTAGDTAIQAFQKGPYRNGEGTLNYNSIFLNPLDRYVGTPTSAG